MDSRPARVALLLLLILLLQGCDIVIRQVEEPPTPAPSPQPGSACAAVSVERLQDWMADRFPRLEKQVAGGTVYLETPSITNCDENRAYYRVRVGFQRRGFLIELGLFEDYFDLRYEADTGRVCVDLHSLLSSELLPKGVEEVGQEIKVADVGPTTAKAYTEGLGMPAEASEQFQEAVARVAMEGVSPEEQGIGTEAAKILMDWSVGDLLQGFNSLLAGLIGACIP